jgi:hypothetical protein
MDRERDTLSKKVKGLVNKQSLDKFPTIYLSINRIYALEKQSEQKNGLYGIRLPLEQNTFLSLFSQEEI